MITLGIETSCDETSIALLKDTQILFNGVSSQIKHHQHFGGVVPELASRKHTEIIHYLIEKALKETALNFSDIQLCASTHAPGLEGSLLIGVSVAKALTALLDIPLVGVHHLWGHLYAHFLTETPPEFPFIGLIVSGGHTMIVKVTGHYAVQILGQTRDDAAGEAFDKVARYLELGYPGGPKIEALAREGNPKAIHFPRAMKNEGYEFSFSGLKTAVIQYIQALKKTDTPLPKADICASFQKAVTDILAYKSIKACRDCAIKTLLVTGGVSANQALLADLMAQSTGTNIQVLTPPPLLCTDNAAMIAAAGYYHFKTFSRSHPDLSALPNLAIDAFI